MAKACGAFGDEKVPAAEDEVHALFAAPEVVAKVGELLVRCVFVFLCFAFRFRPLIA
jgi:hypothetical protein